MGMYPSGHDNPGVATIIFLPDDSQTSARRSLGSSVARQLSDPAVR